MEVGALILIIITSIGAYKVLSASQHIYVGDKAQRIFYDYKYCPEKIKQIPENNAVIFDTLKEAKESYNEGEGCVKDE